MNGALADIVAQGAWALSAVAMLVLGLAALLAPRVATLTGLLAAQAASLAVASGAQAWLQGSWQFLAVAAFTLATKVVALPRGLRELAPVLPEGQGGIAPGLAVAAVTLAALVLAVAAPVAGAGLAMALAVVLSGWLAVALRRDRAGQAAGMLGLENGLVLALVALPVFPGVAALVLATATLPAAALLLLARHLLASRRNAPEEGR
jgi:hydrogenase-4 membrane subunit HyfE